MSHLRQPADTGAPELGTALPVMWVRGRGARTAHRRAARPRRHRRARPRERSCRSSRPQLRDHSRRSRPSASAPRATAGRRVRARLVPARGGGAGVESDRDRAGPGDGAASARGWSRGGIELLTRTTIARRPRPPRCAPRRSPPAVARCSASGAHTTPRVTHWSAPRAAPAPRRLARAAAQTPRRSARVPDLRRARQRPGCAAVLPPPPRAAVAATPPPGRVPPEARRRARPAAAPPRGPSPFAPPAPPGAPARRTGRERRCPADRGRAAGPGSFSHSPRPDLDEARRLARRGGAEQLRGERLVRLDVRDEDVAHGDAAVLLRRALQHGQTVAAVGEEI